MSNHRIGACRLVELTDMRCIQKLLANHRPFSAMRIAHYAQASEMITELKQLSCILRDASVCQMLNQGVDLERDEFKCLIFNEHLWGEEADEATRRDVPGCRNATNKQCFLLRAGQWLGVGALRGATWCTKLFTWVLVCLFVYNLLSR